MKYFVVAGEASGDKQAALLCSSIATLEPAAVIRGWGGDEMIASGVTVTKHYRELAFMGFVEVVKHLPEIFRNLRRCKQEIQAFQPDALILVDYPGFNLRIARWAAKQQLRVYYYISPQLWAWHTSRVTGIKKAVRKMFVILPFEKEFYQQFDMDVTYIGHPFATTMKEGDNTEAERNPHQIALLPGSRRHEIERLLPVMMQVARQMPSYHFVIAGAPHIEEELYTGISNGISNVQILTGDMKRVLRESSYAVVTSGTATLETALQHVPQVVVYKGSPLSYQIAKKLIKVKFISLVNLIHGSLLVDELIQSDCNATNIIKSLQALQHPERKAIVINGYKAIQALLSRGGGAPLAAQEIIADLLPSK